MILFTRAPWVIGASAVATAAVFGYQPSPATSESGADDLVVQPASSAPQAAPPIRVTGPAVMTDYGPVQVSAALDAKTLTVLAARALTFPVELPKSKQINTAAVPVLQRKAVGLKSAKALATISGATFTSDGFRASLAGAIVKAAARPAPAKPPGTGAAPDKVTAAHKGTP